MADMLSMKDIIIRLREKKEQEHYSYTDINALIEKNGDYPLSKSTLSRVFSEGSEVERFSYEDTIRPIAKALLDIENIEDTDTDDVKTLKIILKLKMQRIEELECQLAKEKNKYHEKLDKERERANRSIDFLKEQVAYKDKRMDVLLDAVRAKDELHNRLLEQILNCPCRKAETNGNK